MTTPLPARPSRLYAVVAVNTDSKTETVPPPLLAMSCADAEWRSLVALSRLGPGWRVTNVIEIPP